MTQTSPDLAAPVQRKRRFGDNLRFGFAVALVLVVYGMLSRGSFGRGFEVMYGDGRTERDGPFRAVTAQLEPSQLVLGVAIGLAVAVVVSTRLLREKPDVAAALRTCALAAIVMLVVAATALGWVWIRSGGFEQTGLEAFSHGMVTAPWPLDVTVVTERW